MIKHICESKLKYDAWRSKSETVTQDTRTVYVSQVISMQSKGGGKLVAKVTLRKCTGRRMVQKLEHYCGEAYLIPHKSVPKVAGCSIFEV